MIFVQAVDGLFYNNPILHDEHAFVKFDEDDGPQIFVKAISTSTVESCAKRGRVTLREIGLSFDELNYYMIKKSMFPPNWNHMSPCMIFSFKVLAPIPLPSSYDGSVSMVGSDCVLYAWKMEFDSEDVLDALNGSSIRSWLASFICGHPVLPIEIEGFKKGIVVELEQYRSLALNHSKVIITRSRGLSRT